MIVAGIGVGGPEESALAQVLAASCEARLTYDHVGSTLPDAAHRPRYRRFSAVVGSGEQAFRAAGTAVRTWVPQRGIGAVVLPTGAPVAAGTTVVIVIRRGPVYLVVPNRIVAVLDDPTRFAFAYGSLPGHPERGEEAFVVEMDAEGTVTFTVGVDAVPGSWPNRLSGPVGRRIQRAAIEGYLDALRRHLAAPPATA